MNKATGMTRIIKATGYSFKGLKQAWQHEAAFRQETILTLVGVIIACLLPVTLVEKLLLIGSVVLIMLFELANSAIEAVVDRIGPEHHELSGRAKDIGSAAVFVAILLAAIVWGSILWQHFA
ncbi:diacylglycerol kinase [Pectobacterium carotovorum]|uniref:diacylglycerol kinase n=1 Tax=Pectobacterium carotovorum TaxID=554 RepID=UPI0010FCFD63|nr:diacylglycerol kinase [Pectobacterium carotovorum]KAA3668675.1 diacylglycerol kinase [Pectobacterium carotovorum subsp. carotovorum]MCQ8232851.1 diacylglycerol kinase [Pectobacterium carotovorum]UCZ80096.1 diacylglycerol kinase [Pectobacterium carotovorum]GKW08064.1 diacylglycerol kinase [Pectobacterium carotovorum subsp. carotovorum]